MSATECRKCDGTGWVEGGTAIKTPCGFCGGNGVVITSPRPPMLVETLLDKPEVGIGIDDVAAFLEPGFPMVSKADVRAIVNNAAPRIAQVFLTALAGQSREEVLREAWTVGRDALTQKMGVTVFPVFKTKDGDSVLVLSTFLDAAAPILVAHEAALRVKAEEERDKALNTPGGELYQSFRAARARAEAAEARYAALNQKVTRWQKAMGWICDANTLGDADSAEMVEYRASRAALLAHDTENA